MTLTRTASVTLLAVAAALALAGCSGGGSDARSQSPSQAVVSDGQQAVNTRTPPDFVGTATGIITDLMVEVCDREDGPVTASGTVTNSATRTRDIVVTVSWATTSSSQVMAQQSAVLRQVPAGATLPWSVATTLDSAQPVTCLPIAQSGTLAAATK